MIMRTRLFVALAAAVVFSVAGISWAGALSKARTTADTATAEDCCYPGSPCCYHGSPRCDGSCCDDPSCCLAAETKAAAKADCCADNAPCCDPPQECCLTGRSKPAGSCCEE
jgi:hypothetical protein